MIRSILLASILAVALALVGCGEAGTNDGSGGTGTGGNATTAGTNNGGGTVKVDPDNPATWKEPFKLTEEPEGPIDVLSALNDYEADGEEIVVIGRIQKYIVGSYAISLIDQSMAYCEEDCKCPTPWDYCCEQRDWMASRIPVSFTATPSDGDDLAPKSDRMYLKAGNKPVYRLLDLICVVGKLKKSGDQKVLVATGYFHVERPEIGWDVNWTEIK